MKVFHNICISSTYRSYDEARFISRKKAKRQQRKLFEKIFALRKVKAHLRTAALRISKHLEAYSWLLHILSVIRNQHTGFLDIA